ncbi:hypothetical protein HGRIS_003698 [Hohenbuehelia grisea]|uniref:Repressor of RNA polymerase III transcription MAF1 n=1 Tax=Hohenbuehelia grisea TaxID=104357 RepID=A0ABR3JHU2_9AGAR
MKYIEYPALTRLAQALTHEGPECSVHTRIEAYSCKNIKRDKKLFKSLEDAYKDEVSNSPPLPSWLALDREAEMTPFGPIDKSSSRKTLYLLIATLNIAFPDHEFSDVRPGQFNKEQSGASVLNSLSTTLVSPHRAGMNAPRTYSAYPPTSSDFFPSSVPSTSSSPYHSTLPSSQPTAPSILSGTHPTLYRLLNEVIGLPDCEVYSYAPGVDADPHANDYSDDEDDVASVGDEDSSSDADDDGPFEFDDYDIDEVKPKYRSTSSSPTASFMHRSGERSLSNSLSSVPQNIPMPSFPQTRLKRRGALLWSSHWFFLNRKLKRIVFISVWARSRWMLSGSWTEDELEEAGAGYRLNLDPEMEKELAKERFHGWEGAAGLGARAMGLASA